MDKLIKALEEEMAVLAWWSKTDTVSSPTNMEARERLIGLQSAMDIIKDHTSGKVLVPIEPTEEMVEVGFNFIHDNSYDDLPTCDSGGVYSAMITAYKDKP